MPSTCSVTYVAVISSSLQEILKVMTPHYPKGSWGGHDMGTPGCVSGLSRVKSLGNVQGKHAGSIVISASSALEPSTPIEQVCA